MPDDALPYFWTVDHAVLIEMVRRLETAGERSVDMEAVRAVVGVETDALHRSVNRLHNAEMINVGGGVGLRGIRDGMYMVNGVTERGLRAAGAWPNEAENLASQLIAAFTEAAESTADPDERSRLRTAASSLGAVGQKTITEIVASYLAKMSGA